MSNVLDIPELFWDEASLKALYDAVREYMEIGPRVQVLNEKIAVAEDLVSPNGLSCGHRESTPLTVIEWATAWGDTRPPQQQRDGPNNVDHHLVRTRFSDLPPPR